MVEYSVLVLWSCVPVVVWWGKAEALSELKILVGSLTVGAPMLTTRINEKSCCTVVWNITDDLDKHSWKTSLLVGYIRTQTNQG